MEMCHDQNVAEDRINIANNSYENAGTFKYLGSVLLEQNHNHEEIKQTRT